MSKGDIFWIMDISFIIAASELESVWRSVLDVGDQGEVDINAKGGACWLCSVSMNVNRVLVLFIICHMST